MASRRTILRTAGALPAAALLAACRPQSANPAAVAFPSVREFLLVQTRGGLSVVDGRNGLVVAQPRPGVVACDASTVVVGESPAEVRDLLGTVKYQVPATGKGPLTPRVVAPDGNAVALVGSSGGATVGRVDGSAYQPAGRSETTIVIADATGERKRLTLPGCVEPEAFSANADLLFVLDYLPPEHPDHYRVRMVNIQSGEVLSLLTRDKRVIPPGAEEEMRGEGRQAVYAPTRQLLFTLYTHQADHLHTRDLIGARTDHPGVHAFVHSLHIAQCFAYCIDLPVPFGEGPAQGHAIALDPRGQHPYVVDVTSGTVAALDGEQLAISRTERFTPPKVDGPASAVIASEFDRLFVARGNIMLVLDAMKLTVRSQWTLPGQARGLALSPDGKRLWVGQPDGATAFDVATGRRIASVRVPGLTEITATTPAR
jgi:hypothetical protein